MERFSVAYGGVGIGQVGSVASERVCGYREVPRGVASIPSRGPCARLRSGGGRGRRADGQTFPAGPGGAGLHVLAGTGRGRQTHRA